MARVPIDKGSAVPHAIVRLDVVQWSENGVHDQGLWGHGVVGSTVFTVSAESGWQNIYRRASGVRASAGTR